MAAKLLASAARLTDMADVRMDDIAQASGIPRATLYYYFEGKDDILAFARRWTELLVVEYYAGALNMLLHVPDYPGKSWPRTPDKLRSWIVNYFRGFAGQVEGEPDGRATRLLRVPTAADGGDSAAGVVSLPRVPARAGISPTGTEAGLHRRFTTAASGTYAVKASAVPVSGAELDKLLYQVAPDQQNRIVATADSTAALGADLSARNLTDGDLTTAWVAGDRPTIHLSWSGKQPVGEVVLAPAGGLSTRATQVDISSPDGSTIAGVDVNGVVRFDPITTDRLDITITQTAPLTLHNPVADEDLQLPVGLSEAYIPALDQYRTPQPSPSRAFSLPCGQGPDVAVDGKLYQTSVKGTVADLVERRRVKVTLCQQGRSDSELELASGAHRVEAGERGGAVATAQGDGRARPATRRGSLSANQRPVSLVTSGHSGVRLLDGTCPH